MTPIYDPVRSLREAVKPTSFRRIHGLPSTIRLMLVSVSVFVVKNKGDLHTDSVEVTPVEIDTSVTGLPGGRGSNSWGGEGPSMVAEAGSPRL
jgi:hypothetical protein